MEIGKYRDHHCSFCGSKFKNNSKLQDHIRTHTRERPFTCEKCKRGFFHKGNLTEHMRYKHHEELPGQNEKKHKCSLCPFTTHWKSGLDEHILTHTNERNFPCQHPGCEYAAKTSNQLKIHVDYRHKNERKYLCPVPNCGYRGKTTSGMHRHSKNHSESRPFICDFEGCSYQSKTRSELKCHKLGVHNGGFKPFACSLCNYRAPFKSSLKIHTHAEDKSVKCEFKGCSHSCRSKLHLRDHVRSCHTEKKFKCNVTGCLFSTARRTMLRKHAKRVHAEKPYKCPHCEYRGADLWYMRFHIEKHSITRSHRTPCPNEGCTFQARNPWYLKRHLEFHEENLSCPVQGCGYVGTSSSSATWKYHMQAHDPTDRPILCPLCPKYFPTNRELCSHLPSHTQERPFKCPKCNFAAASKPTIMKHVRTAHPTVSSNFDDDAVCDHCGVNYWCPVGLAMHRIKLKTPIVVLRRLELRLIA